MSATEFRSFINAADTFVIIFCVDGTKKTMAVRYCQLINKQLVVEGKHKHIGPQVKLH